MRKIAMAGPDSCRSDIENAVETPFIHMFWASGHDFVLDLNTNRLFSLEEDEAALLRNWQQGTAYSALRSKYPAAAESIDALRDEGVFDCARADRLALGGSWETIASEITHRRSRTILEVTQDCNLRCRYCTFGGGFPDHRSHSRKRMDPAVLEKAIAAALEAGAEREEIAIGFYGGEPLLAFDLVARGVAFAEAHAGGKRLRFSTTTNGTALTAEKARFLAEHNFAILVSIDGPRQVHNANRIFRNGRGSYDKSIRGLKTLLQAYPAEARSKIGLSIVVPSRNWLPVLEQLWDDEPWLPRSLRVTTSDVNAPEGFKAEEPKRGPGYPAFYQRWFEDKAAGRQSRSQVETSVFEDGYARLHHRPMPKPDRHSFYPNGCCVPGATKIYVDVDGAYKVCERAHGTPDIGSVETGIDLERIRDLVAEYCDASIAECRNCEVVSICNVCFAHAFVNGRFDPDAKRSRCEVVRASLKQRLSDYADLAQRPEFVAKWNEYVFTD